MRITILGMGAVGEACAHLLTGREVVSRLVLANRNRRVADAVRMDLEQSRAWSTPLSATTAAPWDERAVRDADLIILTAGARLKGAESRADKATEVARVLQGEPGKSIADTLAAHTSDEAIVLVVTNPVEATVTWLQQRMATSRRRVIGLGTTVETARFSRFLADTLNVDAGSVWTEIVGEHGPQIAPRDEQALRVRAAGLGAPSLDVARLLQRTRDAASVVRGLSEEVGRARARRILEQLTGKLSLEPAAKDALMDALWPALSPPATRFAVAAAVVAVVEAIASDRGRVLTVSGLPDPPLAECADVALALPFVVGRAGLIRTAIEGNPSEFLRDVAASISEQVDAMNAVGSDGARPS